MGRYSSLRCFLLSVMSKVVASFLIFPVVEQAFRYLTALNFL
jgi:hypothetical protein